MSTIPREGAASEYRRYEMSPAIGGWRRSYANGWCGPESIVAGLIALEKDGAPVTWVVAQHHLDGNRFLDVVTIGRTESSWRYCGGNPTHSPNGAGSYELATVDQGREIAIARLVANLTKPDMWIFRQPTGADGEEMK